MSDSCAGQKVRAETVAGADTDMHGTAGTGQTSKFIWHMCCPVIIFCQNSQQSLHAENDVNLLLLLKRCCRSCALVTRSSLAFICCWSVVVLFTLMLSVRRTSVDNTTTGQQQTSAKLDCIINAQEGILH